MNIIWKISLRNLMRHKGKSLVIGAILFLGALIMTLGNGVINGLVKNTDKNMVQNMTGDIIIVSTNQKEDSVFSGMPRPMKTLSDYRGLEQYLMTNKSIDKFLPMNYGIAMLLTEANHPSGVAYFGVDFKSYQEYFPGNLRIKEGKTLVPGERGIIMNHAYRERYYEDTAQWPIPVNGQVVVSNLLGMAYTNRESLQTVDNVVVMGLSDSGTMKDIRLDFKGIFVFSSLNKLMEQLNFMDIESFREAFGLISAADNQIEVSKDNAELLDLDTENLDDMFGSEDLIGDLEVKNTTLKQGSLKQEKNVINKDLDWKDGSFHFVSIKLNPGVDRNQFLSRLNKEFKDLGMDARGIVWSKAMGQIGNFSNFMRIALIVFVLFVYFVAVIVIMNTLSMNAMERTNEIGMMRAVGAQRKTIGRMFVAETTLLSAIFGGAGIITGTIIVIILAQLNIKAPNEMTQLLFGGDYFKPLIDVAAFIQGIVMLALVTAVAIIYPVKVAKKITPLEAISRE